MWIYDTILQPLLQMVLKKNANSIIVRMNLETLFFNNINEKEIQLDNEL